MINSNTSILVSENKDTCQHSYKFLCIIVCMKTYADRLSWAISNAKLSQTGLANLAKVKPQTVQYLCDKKNNAQGSLHNARFAKILKVSALWLETGEGDRDIPDRDENFQKTTEQLLKTTEQLKEVLDVLKELKIDINHLDVNQIEIIRTAMQVKESRREHLKSIVDTFVDGSDGERISSEQ